MKTWMWLFTIVLFGATIANGKSTKLVTSWKNPEYSGPPFHKILVLGMSDKPGIRADFEDALSKLVTRDGVEATPGNTILLRPEGTKLDLNYLKTQIREFKIDAVIVSRLVKVETNVTYIPGQPYMMPYPVLQLVLRVLRRGVPGRLFAGLSAGRQDRTHRDQRLRHALTGGNHRLDRHQRHVQSALGR